MPIRSPEHHDQRRALILDAALQCFARDGFQGASMADIITTAGVSAGSVYRYFPSKSELIVAAAQSVFMPVRHQFAHFTDADDPVRPTTALAHVLSELMASASAEGRQLAPLILEVWAEAPRDTALREPLKEVYGGIHNDILTLVTRWRDAGHIDANTDVDALATALFALMPGLLVARIIQGRGDGAAALLAFGEATGL
ncbi:TetR/AcrR family transcriptional regulator [Demequina sediminicola]|uniref:TetR/AcrR family transcriptional regulator n=1 Tax=Demequina sediminicola TaxID=1095026 RepID=UPI00128AF738|nr:TetR/AcrR family transcriptional regulator [Demequina sediminicola]